MALAAGSMAALLPPRKGMPPRVRKSSPSAPSAIAPIRREKKIGPGLKGLFKRDKLANGKKVTDATVREQIDQGGNGMPPYKDLLSDDEKDNSSRI